MLLFPVVTHVVTVGILAQAYLQLCQRIFNNLSVLYSVIVGIVQLVSHRVALDSFVPRSRSLLSAFACLLTTFSGESFAAGLRNKWVQQNVSTETRPFCFGFSFEYACVCVYQLS